MTISKRVAAGAIACMCLLAAPIFADTRAELASKAVNSETAAAYAQALAGFDQAVAQNPQDAALAVSRCEFIQPFSDSESTGYLERAEADLDACDEHLKTLQDAPEVQVHQVENEWGEEATKHGKALLSKSKTWPTPLRLKLLTSLAANYRYKIDNDPDGTGIVIQAAELGDVDSIDDAVAALVRNGDTKRAQALLDHAPPAKTDWMASKRVRSAVDMPDKQAALREVRRQQAAGRQIKPWAVALAELRAGDAPAAKKALCKTCVNDEQTRDARFKVALAMHDDATAAKAVDLVGGSDFSANITRFLMLAKASPLSLLRPGMWLSVAVVLACVGFYLLLPGLLLVPVHYRGLARRVTQRLPKPLLDGIRLRHAWLAIAAFLLVPVSVLALVDPAHFAEMVSGSTKPEPKTMLMLVSVSDALCLLLFAPILLGFARAGQFRPATALAAWKQVLLSMGLCLAVGWMLAVVQRWLAVDTMTDQTRMVNDLINHQGTRGGGIVALLVVSLLVPVWEEFSFRGIVLGGMSRHISFGWANLWQALLFAACHDDWPRFPYYLTMGLMSGWLVKRTGKLAPSIFLHMLVNALASFLIRH